MSRFELLMDDMKEAMVRCNASKGVFLPAILGALVSVIITIVIVVVMFIVLIGSMSAMLIGNGFNIGVLIFSITAALFIAVFIVAVTLLVDVGVISTVKGVLDSQPLTARLFAEGLKRYYLRALGTTIGFYAILAVIYAIALIPYILYVMSVGILTGWWGVLLLSLIVQSLIGYWLIIMIDSDLGGFQSIGENLKFGRRHLKIMILILFIQHMLVGTFSSYFGLIGLLAAFAVNALITTYMKMVIMMTYRRYRSEPSEI